MSNIIGVTLRGFASKPEEVEGRVAKLVEAEARLLNLRSGGDYLVGRIDIFIWKKKDCGLTAQELRGRVNTAYVHELEGDDFNCFPLNYGAAWQLGDSDADILHSLTLSTKAVELATEENLRPMLDDMDAGARVVGLAMDELASVVRAGRIQNTFALWDIISLLSVGGFDLRAAQVGCEEMIPLARMVERFGPCIAPAEPVGEAGLVQYESGSELALRHQQIIDTKEERQKQMLDMVGRDFTFIESGILRM